MKLIDFYRKYGSNNYTVSVISIFFEDYPQRRDKVKKFVKQHADFELNIPDESELVPLMSKVNREVKHPTCPGNLRNRFYTKKRRVIDYLLHNKKIDCIIESENLYNFVVGEYSFHQPKDYWPNGFKKIAGTEVYEAKDEVIPFNRDDFNRFFLAATGAFVKQRKKR